MIVTFSPGCSIRNVKTVLDGRTLVCVCERARQSFCLGGILFLKGEESKSLRWKWMRQKSLIRRCC